jgi:hypothetical protein
MLPSSAAADSRCLRPLQRTTAHAIYGEHEALVEINTGHIHEGYLPPKALQLVNEWRRLHLDELMEAWRRSREELPLKSIEPLE